MADFHVLDEIISEYEAQKAEINAQDYSALVVQKVHEYEMQLMKEYEQERSVRVKEIDISIDAVKAVKARLEAEQANVNAVDAVDAVAE